MANLSVLGALGRAKQQEQQNSLADRDVSVQEGGLQERIRSNKVQEQRAQIAQISAEQDKKVEMAKEVYAKSTNREQALSLIQQAASGYVADEKLKQRALGNEISQEDMEMLKQQFIDQVTTMPTQTEAYQQETDMMIGRDQAIREATPTEDEFAPETDEGKRVKEMADAKRIYGENSTEYKQLNEFFAQTGQEDRDDNIAGKRQVSTILSSLKDAYIDLQDEGAAIDTEKAWYKNLQNYLASTGTGQEVAAALGTDAQSIRNSIKQTKPLLINAIRQASDMGSRGLDSEKELAFYLEAATDPTRDIKANYKALELLDRAYGLSGTEASDEELNKLIEEFSILDKSAPQRTIKWDDL